MRNAVRGGGIDRRLVLLAGPSLLVSACITDEQKTAAMTERTPPATQGGVAVTGAPAQPAPPAIYRRAIGLGTVRGEPGSGTSMQPPVTTEQFSEALRRSLSAAGVLAESDPARFALDAQLESINRPFLGFNYEVRSVTRYRLVEVATGREVLSLQIEETGVSRYAESSQAYVRIQLAEVRSIRQSIARVIAALYGKPQI
jgi:hypothetical protein